MRRIELSPRLKAVADFVRKDAVVADVGTDHGFLIGYLAQQNLIQKGFACDVNPGPLSKADNLIKSKNLENKLETVLTDGLIGMQDKGLTDIVMAGMGGELMMQIIDQAPWIKSPDISLILQPMTRDFMLREYLYENGFEIQKEKAVADAEFVYSIILAKYTGVFREVPLRFAWGGLIWEQSNDAAIEYLDFKYQTLTKMEPSFNRREGFKEMYLEFKERLDK